jgi:hypothetical protein
MRRASNIYTTSCVIGVIALMFAVLTAVGQPTTLNVSGEVKGADGMPKRFARVQLEGPGNYIAITNTRGEFSIANVQPGRYVATITQGDNIQKLPVNIATAEAPVKITVKW